MPLSIPKISSGVQIVAFRAMTESTLHRCSSILFPVRFDLNVCLVYVLPNNPQSVCTPARTAHGESGPAPTTAGPAPFDESTSASSPRSLVLDRPFTIMAGLALSPSHR